MTDIVVVFLSYNQKDKELKLQIQKELYTLCGDKIKIVSDDNIGFGLPTHEEISRLIDSCDILIPIITDNWLISNETRDEAVRAHERKRLIRTVLKETENSKILDKDLPYYMREPLRIHFTQDNFRDQLEKVADTIKNFKNFWVKDLINELSKIGSHLLHKDFPSQREIEYAKQEIRHLEIDLEKVYRHNQFRKNVSYESNFLTQASPFFKTAKKIYAVSFEKISSFWQSPNTQHSIHNYLSQQSEGDDKRIFRLFVFETPDETNDFKNILSVNHGYYGDKGGVFVCSLETYVSLIRELSGEIDVQYRLQSDFGLLIYERNEIFVATLDPKDFFIEKFHINSNWFYQNFITYVDKNLMSLADGGAHKKIVRWADFFLSIDGAWSNALNNIFPERHGKVTHIVLFNIANSKKTQVFNKLLYLKKTLKYLNGSRKFVMLSIDLLSKLEHIEAMDGKYYSALNLCTKYDFALIETFIGKGDLESYYQNEIHSSERQELYQIINPSIKAPFLKLKKLLNTNNYEKTKEEIRLLYNQIEIEMSNYMTRIDLIDELPITYIAEQPGIPFRKNYI